MSCRASTKFRTIFNHFLANQSANASHIYIQRAFSRFGDGCVKVLFGESRSKITAWTQSVNHKLTLLSDAFAKQCNGLAAQRVRRTSQLLEFYKQLYGDKIFDKVIRRLGVTVLRHCKGRMNPVYMLIGGVPLFTWEKEKITDEEIECCVEEMKMVHAKIHQAQFSQNKAIPGGWEIVIDRPNLKAWRRPVENSYLYQYKVYGSFYDVAPKAFFQVQVDLDYRLQWDVLTIDLKVVDQDQDSGSEVIHWKMKFPYPMYARDYVYVRRHVMDLERRMMVITARSVEHHNCPESTECVRVMDFQSTMVIQPHTSFEENGLDYILTYFDDPKANFPTFAYNWMASTGVPDFLEKVHQAALSVQERQQGKPRATALNCDSNYSTPPSQLMLRHP